ncbi:helix-turn-helix domain-containing protein [Parahaliea maris]|uniref:Helix-turn-helix domain-containing protein n=1 Tax=Parahaliea maris TaxID=2716870 RepID=A0A5C9A8A7_9GAMM|nr:helix-turn-helix domain-containing protein [Parahaliea maris]TXS95797.1 helix-turn-helix domain-containing protein [Parahaliea maris]
MIRSVSRALDILELLNRRDSITALELARELAAPRATIYRILETLVAKGFIYQHESDNQFRLAQGVTSLSRGYTCELQLASVAKPLMKGLTERLAWPLSLAVISGSDLVVIENTDRFSPLAVEKFNVGHRMPVLRTASGLCLLAFSDAKRRAETLSLVGQASDNADNVLQSRLHTIRERGFARQQRSRGRVKITAVSVPVSGEEGRKRAALTLRFTEPAVSREILEKAIIPAMLHTAAEISAESGAVT